MGIAQISQWLSSQRRRLRCLLTSSRSRGASLRTKSFTWDGGFRGFASLPFPCWATSGGRPLGPVRLQRVVSAGRSGGPRLAVAAALPWSGWSRVESYSKREARATSSSGGNCPYFDRYAKTFERRFSLSQLAAARVLGVGRCMKN